MNQELNSRIQVLAEAGLCAGTFAGAREFLKDIRALLAQKFPEDDFWLVQDTRSFVGNDVLFWKKDDKGYTTNVEEARLFSRTEAFRQASARSTDRPWPRKYIFEKSRPVVDFQEIDHSQALATKLEFWCCSNGQKQFVEVCKDCAEAFSAYNADASPAAAEKESRQ